MKILLINKFWKPQGGADRYALWLCDALQAAGHEVFVFSVEDPDNLPITVPHALVSHVETAQMRWRYAPRTIGRMVWSFEAQRRLRAFIRVHRPDVAHVHNLYTQLSPSVLPVLQQHGIPVVGHVHDYGMTSANYSLFDERGIDRLGTFWSVIRRRGVKRSLPASVIAALVFSLHRLLRVYERGIDRLIFTTPFVQHLFHARGWRGDRGVVIPYVVDVHEQAALPKEDLGYFLFVGRLHTTKGVQILIEAARRTGLPVKIVGEGPDEQRLRQQAGAMTNIEWLGTRSATETHRLMRQARAVVVPSVWWEPFGMVAIEPQGVGTPVIASRIGGLADLVIDGQTGVLVAPEDVDELARAMTYLAEQPEKARVMGALGKRRFAEHYGIQTHLRRLEEVYRSVLRD